MDQRPSKKARLDDSDGLSQITSLGFNDPSRFLPGEKLSSLTSTYESSSPYAIPPSLSNLGTNTSSFPTYFPQSCFLRSATRFSRTCISRQNKRIYTLSTRPATWLTCPVSPSRSSLLCPHYLNYATHFIPRSSGTFSVASQAQKPCREQRPT
jgi:hypothetical protein